MARPADAGKRAQSDPPTHLKVMPDLRAPAATRARGGPGRGPFPPGSTPTPRSKSRPTDTLSLIFDGYSVDLGSFSAGAAQRGARAAHRSAARHIVIRRPARRRPRNRSLGPAAGPARSPGIPRRAIARRRRPGRHRAAGRRLLAATTPLGNGDVLVLSRFAYLRRRGNAMVLEVAARRRAVQDLQSGHRGRHRPTVHAAASRTAPPAGWFSRARAARPAGGLPDPVQGR